MALPGLGLDSPADLFSTEAGLVAFDVTYTDNTDQLQASSVVIEIDTVNTFYSGDLITSTFTPVNHNTTCRMAAPLADGTWYWRATATNADGTTVSGTRSLTVARQIKRVLYEYENIAKYGPDWTQKRALYQYENVAKYGPDWTKKRALYQYENITDEPPFPYIERLSTTRTSQGSVVTIYGNGFGAKAASDPLNADRAARGYGGAVYLGDKQCGIVSWSWQEITFTVPVDAVSGAVFVRLLTPDPPGERDSNLKGLEIYEAPPTTDTGLELFVCDKNHPNTVLAQLDAATEKSFYVQRNASGSGMFRISRLDVKGSDRALVTDQNYILCRLNGVDVFKWIIESRKPAYVDDSEEQWIDVSGRGNMAVLDQAIIYPEGMPYPASLERVWADTHGAAIFLQLFSEAKARGCFPYVTVDFTADHDSLGMPWTDYTDVSFHAGTKLGKVAEKLTSGFGLFDLYMTPTFILKAFKGAENYPGRGTNLSDKVRFFKGQSILSHENQSDSTNIENIVLVEGDAGSLVEVTHNLTPSVENYGRREGYLQARNVPDDWTQLANYGKIKADKSGQVAWGIKLATDFAYHKPFDTYNMGDWIWVHIEPEGSDIVGFDGEVRVVGITVTEDEDLRLSAQLELNNIMLERELIMAQLLERLSMGSTDPQMTNPSEEPPAGIEHNHFHGLLLGLEDDTHPQYYNVLRHAADPHSALARVTSIKRQGSDALAGDVTLVAGSNVTLTQDTEQKTITIAASGGGGGGGGGGGYPAYNPDEPPTSPSDEDDEFEGDTLDVRWSWANQGAATAAVGDLPSMLTLIGELNSWYRCLTQPVPAGDWSVIAKVHFGGNFWADAYAGIVLLPAADGGVESLVIGKDGTTTPTKIRAERWSNWTSWGAERKVINYGPTHAYLRIDWDNTAGKARYLMSSDGRAWAGVIDWTTLSFTPGRFGLAVRGSNLPQYFEFFRKS